MRRPASFPTLNDEVDELPVIHSAKEQTEKKFCEMREQTIKCFMQENGVKPKVSWFAKLIKFLRKDV